MSELKIRSANNRPWESIETNRTTIRKVPTWGWSAHRGAYMEGLPENSIPALIRAKERGFAWSECDTKVTSDGVVVICHNDTITGLNAEGVSTTLTIAESTAAEVCALRWGPYKRFGYIHPPTLDELLNAAYYADINVIIHAGSATAEEGTLIAQSVVRNGMVGRVIYLTTGAAIETIVAVDRQAKYEYCCFGMPGESTITGLAETAKTLNLAYCGMDLPATGSAEDISTAVERMRKVGLGVSFWNVGADNYMNCIKHKPTAITLVSDTVDFHTWEKEYLDTVKLW